MDLSVYPVMEYIVAGTRNNEERGDIMPVYEYKDYLRVMKPLPDYVDRDSYGIPYIEANEIDVSDLNNGKWLINMKNVSTNDKNSFRKIVHSLCYDNVLQRHQNNMPNYLKRTAGYYALSSFDFSMDPRMDFPVILNAVYNNRWTGAYMQVMGRRVIPTVGWLLPDTYDICFAGLRDGSTFIISTLGVNNFLSAPIFLDGYRELRSRFPLATIICVGDRIAGMDSDICYVRYEDSFGNWDKYQDYWQPSLYNWDGSISKGAV